MTYYELETLCRPYFYLHNLCCLKRCHGPNASMSFVLGEGKTKRCRTIRDLIDADVGVPSFMAMYEKEFANIPPIAASLDDNREILIVLTAPDGGPESPWETARKEQEAARSRLAVKRKLRQLELTLETSQSAPFDFAI